MVYTYNHGKYTFYQLLEQVDRTAWRAEMILTREYKNCDESNGRPNLAAMAGVFQNLGPSGDRTTVQTDQIKGKAVLVKDCILSVPKNLLLQ